MCMAGSEQSPGGVTLVAGVAVSRPAARSQAGCAALHNHTCQSPPHRGQHLVTAPDRAAALPGKVFYFGKNVFIRPILSAYISQSQGRRRAVQEPPSLQRLQLCSLAEPSGAGTHAAEPTAPQDAA